MVASLRVGVGIGDPPVSQASTIGRTATPTGSPAAGRPRMGQRARGVRVVEVVLDADVV